MSKKIMAFTIKYVRPHSTHIKLEEISLVYPAENDNNKRITKLLLLKKKAILCFTNMSLKQIFTKKKSGGKSYRIIVRPARPLHATTAHKKKK